MPEHDTFKGLVMNMETGGLRPQIRCSTCGKAIAHIGDGAVVWTPVAGMDETTTMPVVFLCKRDGGKPGCVDRVSHSSWPYVELGVYFVRLLHHLGVQTDEQFSVLRENAEQNGELL